MADAKKIEAAIRQVKGQQSFIQALLVDALGWPVDQNATGVEDISYQWSKQELQAQGLDENIVAGTAHQIVLPDNPWGIFILEFKNPEIFATGRGMTGTLRRLLRGLVPKRRAIKNPKLKSFQRENLLFICNHDYKNFRFAHFKAPGQASQAAPLAAFGWGPGDPIRTLCEFNVSSLEWPSIKPSTEEQWVSLWSQAFSVEKVTDRFYKDYRQVFEKVEKVIGKEKTLKPDEVRMFTQMLFNRLLFLRFVERKGWLKFPGQSGTNYLSALFGASGIGKRSFYESRLKPLFFQGLRIEGKHTADAYGKVPFLNGGLFEKSPLDEKIDDIPDTVFTEVLTAPSAARDGGLFYRYNFTVEESTPLDIEVAVDPEMLGKVFEELVTGRHESGAYYTPRPVVSFMCREAIKEYLADKTKAPASAIDMLVDTHEVKGLTEAHSKQVLDALDSLKAVDPACGSGAYLLGLLQELIGIRRALQSEKLARDPMFLFNLKLQTISHNLYGVDIDPFATNIAMLRLWLSLAVEAAEPLPLPNLDFKIETGDSLTGSDPSTMPDLFREQLQRRADLLVKLKDKYLNTHDATKHSQLEIIRNEEIEIAKRLHSTIGESVVDWRIHFADVFGKGGGFDIVLANPPYIDSETMTKHHTELREAIRASYSMTKGNWDIYIAFFEMGFRLLNSAGVLCFITPDKWLSKPFGEELRIRTAKNICCILNVGRNVFQSANVDAIVSVFTTREQPQLRILQSAATHIELVRTVQKATLGPPFAYDWLFSDCVDLLIKIDGQRDKLSRYGECENACATSDAYKLKELLQEQPTGARSGYMRIINTGTIGKYTSKWGAREMVYLGDRYARPVVNKANFLREFPNSYGKKAVKPKLILKGLNLLDVCLDDDGSVIPGKTTLMITSNDSETLHLLLAVTNSAVAFYYLKYKYPASSYNQGTTFTKEMVNNLPVPQMSSRDRSTLVTLAQRIVSAKTADPTADTTALERESNSLICNLYGLNSAEIKMVEGLRHIE
jgi:type I restriction-modification system DNA methylase subunit